MHRKDYARKKGVYAIADPGTGTDRAAQSLVLYPALKKIVVSSRAEIFFDQAAMVQKAENG